MLAACLRPPQIKPTTIDGGENGKMAEKKEKLTNQAEIFC